MFSFPLNQENESYNLSMVGWCTSECSLVYHPLRLILETLDMDMQKPSLSEVRKKLFFLDQSDFLFIDVTSGIAYTLFTISNTW